MPDNAYLATPIFCHTAVLYYAKLPLFHGRNFLLILLLILEIFNLNCFSYMTNIYEDIMHARICLEHTVSTNSVTVTFKAKPIAAVKDCLYIEPNDRHTKKQLIRL